MAFTVVGVLGREFFRFFVFSLDKQEELSDGELFRFFSFKKRINLK